jgi:hypothetical protein
VISQKRIEKWKPVVEDYLALAAVTPHFTVNQYCHDKTFGASTLYKVARELGHELVVVKQPSSMNLAELVTPEQLARLEGHLLGDACLIKAQARKRDFCLVHSSKHREYSEWVTKTLEALKDRPLWDRIANDTRTGKVYSSFYVRSYTHPLFTSAWQRWYPGGNKCVPRDLVLRPETLLTWFLDDGSKATHGGMYLATDGFTLDEVETLCELLTATFGFKTSPHKNDGHHRIYIPARDRSAFTDVIGPCPVQCFSYKW